MQRPMSVRLGSVSRFGTMARLALGLLVSGAALWLLLRKIDFTALGGVFGSIIPFWTAMAAICFAIAIILRGWRWQIIVREVVAISPRDATAAFIVGQAFNVILPARVGELIRVDYLRRRNGLARVAGLGSIVLEKLQDGFIVVVMLAVGLTAQVLRGGSYPPALLTVAVAAILVFGGVSAILLVLSLRRTEVWFLRWPVFASRLATLRSLLTVVQSHHFFKSCFLAIILWCWDLASLSALLRSLGVSMDATGLMLLTGTYALSSLIPAGPANIGTYQLAFALVLPLEGWTAEQGIVAATLVQVCFLGPMAVAGFAIYFFTVGRQTVVQ